MKRTIISLSLALIAVFASAQTDSLTMEKKTHALQEIVVKSDVAMTSAEKSTYLPTRKQRNAATDAVALLQHMMIPQLSIDPMSETVKTIANEEVAIFIDFLPATKEDLQGMNTQDVKRVEIYDFPKDVRFQNKPHVINFVMQKYTLGGYTKLTTTNMVLADFTSNNSVYSKLAHKNWTFDANLSGRFSNKNHMGMEKTETFRLAANPTTRAELFDNPSQTITRTETAHDGKQRTERNSASLRATYATEKMQLANRFEFLDEITPRQELWGSVQYSPAIFPSTTSESRRDSRQITPTYRGDWNFFLPNDWSLSVSPEFLYSHNEQNRFYKETTTIENEIREDMTELDWFLDLSKSFGRHSLSFTHFGMNYNSQLDYKGSTVSNYHIRNLALSQGASYSYSAEKFNASANFSYNYLLNKVGNETERFWHPSFGLSGTYSPNSKNSLSLSFNYLSSAPTDPQLNPSLMQENELMFYRGNPALKNYGNYITKLQYNWMPTNKITASAYVQDVFVHDFIANVYDLTDDGTAILRRKENVGDAHFTNFSASFTLRLLDGNLQLNASPYFSLIDVSGQNELKSNVFYLDLKASYYLGKFYFHGGYSLPEKKFHREETAWLRDRSTYYLTAGWGNAHWKAKLDIVNPFRTDWRNKRTEIKTPLYVLNNETFNSSSHQRLNLTLTYIFNYGKKVKQGNELGTATGGQSSIL